MNIWKTKLCIFFCLKRFFLFVPKCQNQCYFYQFYSAYSYASPCMQLFCIQKVAIVDKSLVSHFVMVKFTTSYIFFITLYLYYILYMQY